MGWQVKNWRGLGIRIFELGIRIEIQNSNIWPSWKFEFTLGNPRQGTTRCLGLDRARRLVVHPQISANQTRERGRKASSRWANQIPLRANNNQGVPRNLTHFLWIGFPINIFWTHATCRLTTPVPGNRTVGTALHALYSGYSEYTRIFSLPVILNTNIRTKGLFCSLFEYYSIRELPWSVVSLSLTE